MRVMNTKLAVMAQGCSRPLQLAAIKSRLGHTEAGAGVMGALQVVKCLTGGAAEPVLHLRAVNLHVAGVLGSTGSSACAARQAGAALDGGRTEGHCLGVSSFAFQVMPKPQVPTVSSEAALLGITMTSA